MPWQEVSKVDARREFVRLARLEGANRRELCRRFGIHPDTGYKWLKRWNADETALADRSRRPHSSPMKTTEAVEAGVVAIRDAHPAWGARKIARCLQRDGMEPPAVSTVHAVLRRHGRIQPSQRAGAANQRFEKEAANLLWQMDFKGWIRLAGGERCHPLTMIDDHSRYAPCLKACANQQGSTVRTHLQTTFERYGLPEAMFVDNGAPWGGSGGDASGRHWTRLRVWLLKLGVALIYSTPYHPQSRGKNERFHRTMANELFALHTFQNLDQVQRALDAWREVYNFERPHEAIGLAVPADRYRQSPRPFPATLPEVEYDADEIVRIVPSSKDYISFKGRLWKVPEAFRSERVAIRPQGRDGQYGVFFASHQIATIDLTKPKTVGHVSEQVSAFSPE
ncbi:MAG TPA: IS481 family transposase [Beijerinckiaceae bacterium]|jgi:transposase InsO family protein|nr:IS481 family transposase [Beijerinckiaceae bacterium]